MIEHHIQFAVYFSRTAAEKEKLCELKSLTHNKQ